MSEILMIIYDTFKAGNISLGIFQIAIGIICMVGGAAFWFYIIVIATCPIWISIGIINNIFKKKIYLNIKRVIE